MDKPVHLCPFCKQELSISNVSSICSGFYYGCPGKDHQYREHFDADEGEWMELDLQGATYYGNDIFRVCKLKAFT